jgi:uncharacterized membrane protein YraQ (UPF0718 family)
MGVFYPLEFFVEWLTLRVLSLQNGSMAAGAVSFFIADIIKIFILLAVIIFAVSFLRTYLPRERVRKILSQRKHFGNVFAALLGIITPFCTCSAIPLFLGFIEAGVPLGVTFSFLVASPMINEVALVLLLAMFGWKIALLYIASGLVIAVVSGIIIGWLKPEKLLIKTRAENIIRWNYSGKKISQRLEYAAGYSLHIIKKVWIYIIVGVGLGAWIHGYVPADFLASYAGAGKWYAVPLATLIGIPLYSNAAGVVPLISALVEKGVSTGTALSFMMAVTALSLPEFMILSKVMKPKLILLFALIVGLGIIFTGYLFNAIIG